MNRRTFVILGLTFLSLGAGVMALGLVEEESTVRQVNEVIAAPAHHQSGTWTIVGVPQPTTVPTLNGTSTNPGHQNKTTHITFWELDGKTVQSVHALQGVHEDGRTRFHFTNTTRVPGQDALSVTEATWHVDGHAFPIEGFAMEGGSKEWVWAVYEGVLKEPLQPKPSQFTGRLATSFAGTSLPAGAHLLLVDEITIGCSSKFLPEEFQESKS